MLTNFKRVLHFAIIDFFRNKGMSVAAVFVLMVTTMLITGLFLIHGASRFLIVSVRDRIDITAYFKDDTTEDEIMAIKDEIMEKSPDIKRIAYVSSEDALRKFNERHKDNPVFSQALSEVGGNPFLPSLNITTSGDQAEYEKISNVLQEDGFSDVVEKVDFSQKKDTIEKIFSIMSNINKFGLILGGILIIIAMLVVFNTIRLVIENSKEEISTMRIVGATNWFIKAPFIIEGVIFGVISFLLCLVITLAASYFISPSLAIAMPGFNLFSYLIYNLVAIMAIQLGFGVGLGAISSLIVIRKHLKV